MVCLRVDGDHIVVGGLSNPFGGGGGPPPPPTYFTLYLTDNGPDGFQDTVAFDGPGSNPPDCDSTGGLQDALTFGQVTILDTPSEDADP